MRKLGTEGLKESRYGEGAVALEEESKCFEACIREGQGRWWAGGDNRLDEVVHRVIPRWRGGGCCHVGGW